MKDIYIIADSPSPDVYINILCKCVLDNGDKIRNVKLYHIKPNEKSEVDCTTREKIVKQLNYIMEGKYLLCDNKSGKQEVVDLDDNKLTLQNFYQKTSKLLPRCMEFPVTLEEFKEVLRKIKRNDEVIFDITTVKNDLLANLMPHFIHNGISNKLYYFHVNRKLEHNEKDLLHRLQPSEYEYEKIVGDKTNEFIYTSKKTTRHFTVVSSFCVTAILILILSGFNSSILNIIGLAFSCITWILEFIYSAKAKY